MADTIHISDVQILINRKHVQKEALQQELEREYNARHSYWRLEGQTGILDLH